MATGFLVLNSRTVRAIWAAKYISDTSIYSCSVCADSHCHVCRPEDYWLGYKLFCFAYYSHSIQHELEFENSKLGSCISFKLQLCGVWLWVFATTSFDGIYDGCCYEKFSTVLFVHRATCVAAACAPTSSFSSCYPGHVHAAPPSCGDVLQVGVGGGLLKFAGSHAPFRFGRGS